MVASLSKKSTTVLIGIALILFGAATLLLAQRQAVPRVLQLEADGGYLGIEMEDVTAETLSKYKLGGETGVIVRSVVKGSPAELAHLQENDVILEYAGFPVFSMAQLSRLVSETPVNRTVNLTVSRDGKKLSLTIKVGERKGSISDRFQLLPRELDRQFLFDQPGGGVFQFRAPEGRNRFFSWTMPNAGQVQLGATVESLTDQMAEFLGVPGKKGLLVNSVAAGSPASSALRAGDVIVSADGKAVATPSDLVNAMAGKGPGSKLELRIVRDKKEISVTIDLSKSAASGQGIKV